MKREPFAVSDTCRVVDQIPVGTFSSLPCFVSREGGSVGLVADGDTGRSAQQQQIVLEEFHLVDFRAGFSNLHSSAGKLLHCAVKVIYKRCSGFTRGCVKKHANAIVIQGFLIGAR